MLIKVWSPYFTLSSNSANDKSERDVNVRLASSIDNSEVTGFGTATTNIPADLAALTPFGESSNTTASFFWTCSCFSAARNTSGLGLVLPNPTSSSQTTTSK